MQNQLSTAADRFKAGKALRQAASREAHADVTGGFHRDAVAILAESDPTRVPELVPVRYQRMTTDPFAFLRGAAAVMAHDLAGQPVAGIPVQACGDCHLMNFGAFGTPEDNVLFDVNDFDETLPGIDFTIDLKRLSASVAVAALAGGAPRGQARSLAAASVEAYRERMHELATLSPLEIWHARVELGAEIDCMKSRAVKRKLSTILASTKDQLESDDNFPKLTTTGSPTIADKPPLIFHLDLAGDTRHRIDVAAVLAAYETNLIPAVRTLLDRYRLADVAFKAVGVGSVGTFCAIALLVSGDGAPLFLQMKEAQTSALERLAPGLVWSGHQGQRVVDGQRTMQAASDEFLAAASDPFSNRAFYVRHLKNRRLGGVSEFAEASDIGDYARLCGRTLARAHARSGDTAMIAGYMGKNDAFADALASFALAYAAQTKADHAALVAAHPPSENVSRAAR